MKKVGLSFEQVNEAKILFNTEKDKIVYKGKLMYKHLMIRGAEGCVS